MAKIHLPASVMKCGLSLMLITGSYSAMAANVSYSVSMNTSTPGLSGSFLLAPSLDNPGPTTAISGVTPITLGSFQTEDPNSNVVSKFDLTISATISSGAVTDTESFTFYGSVTSPSAGVYDLNFSNSPTSATGPYYTDPSYPTVPPGSLTFVEQSAQFKTLGTYDIGVVSVYPINSSMGKTTQLFGIVAPAAPTGVPEPLSAGLSGIALVLIAGVGLRRRAVAKSVR